MSQIDILKKGHKKFKNVKFKENESRFRELIKKGQNPKALFIGCSDSRVMPTMITSSQVGDLFVVRNIGNFVPPFKPDDDFHATAAAIEYAVDSLGISDIIICGHSDCGAIKAVHQNIKQNSDNIHTIKWLELGNRAKEVALLKYPDADNSVVLRETEKISVVFQLDNLLTYPSVKKGVKDGTLFLHGWYYHIESGMIEYYDDKEMMFMELDEG